MKTQLGPSDARILSDILECGRQLEALWPKRAAGDNEPSELLHKLQRLVRLSEKAESEDLRRLVFHAGNLNCEISARHLAAILVPFERLSRRQLRDDRFLIDDTDRSPRLIRETVALQVIADNIRSAFNVGAILRTAEGLGLESAVLTGYTSTPDDEKTAATSMGAQDHIPWRSSPTLTEAIAAAKIEGYSVVALETTPGAKTIGEFNWPAKCALVIGNERFGLESDALASADHVVRVPMRGRKNSLNVAIAFGIAAQDFITSREKKSLRPIGVFRGAAQFPYEARRQAIDNHSTEIGEIVLTGGAGFESALAGLISFSRIWLLFGFHHNSNWKAKVRPPRGPRTKQGVFATRSPYRPNGLGLSSVELIGIEGLRLKIRGFDLLDGSPIYDIKPYLPYADAFPEATAGWAEGLDLAAYTVRLADSAGAQLDWLEKNGVSQLRGFVFSQLEFDPLDRGRKRLKLSERTEGPHLICYRTWRAEFHLEISSRTVEVTRLFSGYTKDELHAATDRYSDKEVHRQFAKHFGETLQRIPQP